MEQLSPSSASHHTSSGSWKRRHFLEHQAGGGNTQLGSSEPQQTDLGASSPRAVEAWGLGLLFFLWGSQRTGGYCQGLGGSRAPLNTSRACSPFSLCHCLAAPGLLFQTELDIDGDRHFTSSGTVLQTSVSLPLPSFLHLYFFVSLLEGTTTTKMVAWSRL